MAPAVSTFRRKLLLSDDAVPLLSRLHRPAECRCFVPLCEPKCPLSGSRELTCFSCPMEARGPHSPVRGAEKALLVRRLVRTLQPSWTGTIPTKGAKAACHRCVSCDSCLCSAVARLQRLVHCFVSKHYVSRPAAATAGLQAAPSCPWFGGTLWRGCWILQRRRLGTHQLCVSLTVKAQA